MYVVNGKINPEILETKDGRPHYGGSLDLSGTAIINYPVVYNCGDEDRAIYLDLEDKRLIRIGCFVGEKSDAIHAIKQKYDGEEAEEYISKVEECFQIWERMKNKETQEVC